MTQKGVHKDLAVFVGSGSTCQIRIQAPDVEPVHAILQRKRGRLFVRDRGSRAGTFVNGRRVSSGRWWEVTRHDIVEVANSEVAVPDWFFVNNEPLGVWSTPIHYRTSGRQTGASTYICDGLYINARPGTLTAIMGPSGSGKSVFLNLLNGQIQPERGAVALVRSATDGGATGGELLDLNQHTALAQDRVGYVPQDDLMIPELTVSESLHYRLKLRYPDMARAVRESLIDEACLRLGFTEEEPRRKFLHTIVGSALSGYRGLSGGERKRANIALELVNNPTILFLDEPTSGLSSVEADKMIVLLRYLSRDEHMTVLATVHQPSRVAFHSFDDVLLVSPGGRLAYYGPASRATEYLSASSKMIHRSDYNPAEFILEVLGEPEYREKLVREFNYQGTRPSYAPSPLTEDQFPATSMAWPVRWRLPGLRDVAAQFVTLLRRSFTVLARDRNNIVLMIGQAPVISALIILAFSGFTQDMAETDRFARNMKQFQELKAPLERAGEPIPVDRLIRQAAEEASTDKAHLIAAETAGYRASIYFLLVATSIWFGMISSCREIVGEMAVLRREVRAGLLPSSYLGAKLGMLVILVGVQTGILAFGVGWELLNLSLVQLPSLWAVLWLTAAAAVGCGLLLSSVSASQQFALTAVPLIILPQLVFGGLLRPPIHIAPDTLFPRLVSGATIQKWGFQGTLACDTYAQRGVLQQEVSGLEDIRLRRYGEVNLVRFKDVGLEGLFFPGSNAEARAGPRVFLIMQLSIFLMIAYVGLIANLKTR